MRFNKKKGRWVAKGAGVGAAAPAGAEGAVPAAEVAARARAFEEAYATFPHAGFAPPPPPPPPRTKWTRLVRHPVLIGHAASPPRTKWTRRVPLAGFAELSRAVRASNADPRARAPPPAGDVAAAAAGSQPGAAPPPGGELFLDQLLAAAAMVDRELSAARAPAAPAAPGPEAEACAGGGGGWEEAVFRAWAKSHVVRLGLCPWAEAAMPTARRAPRPPRRAPEAQRKRSRQHARPGALRIPGAAAAATAARGRR